MTTRDLTTPYDPFKKFLKEFGIGFDREFKLFDDLAQSTAKFVKTTFPPYNIKKVSDNKYLIELAVAGFNKQDIELTIDDNVLTIKGSTQFDSDEVEDKYLVKGIAERSFTRSFNLADTVEIKNASLVNGMLKVALENMIPETKKPRRVEINDGDEVIDNRVLLNEKKGK